MSAQNNSPKNSSGSSRSGAKRRSTKRPTASVRKGTSRASNGSLNRHLHSMKADVASLRDDAGRLVHGLEEVASAKVGQIAGRSKEEIEHAHKQVRDFVSQRPITCVLVALGAGAIMARLLR